MRSILSATALSALLALAVPAVAQTGSAGTGSTGTGSMGTGSMGTTPGGAQMQGQTPGSPLPMTQPDPGTASTTQRPSTAAGAMGSTSGSQPGTSGMGQQNMGQQNMGSAGSSAPQSMTMDETQVRDLLRSQGYSEVQSVMRDGDAFRARVMRNGRPAEISIDAYTGTIRNQAARR